MESLTFKLTDFEGPLDLLLHLIAKNKLNIYDIEITLLIEQYLAFVQKAQEMNLEILSEFLEMAARLVYIKTVMLLPRHEEVEALKQELTGELLEYQACKRAAKNLSALYLGDQLFVRVPQSLPMDMTYHLTHSPQILLQALASLAGKRNRRLPPPVDAFSAQIKTEYVPVESKISEVLKLAYREESFSFAELFHRDEGRSSMVATFLAVLELLKSKRLWLYERSGEYILTKNAEGLS